MEELDRGLMHQKLTKTERRPKPSEAFTRHFGEQHGVELPSPTRCGYKRLSFFSEGEERPLPSQRSTLRKTP